MSRYHGKAGQVKLSTTGTGVPGTVTLSEWSLSLATDKVDVTSLGDTNKVFVAGLPNYQGSFSGFWDNLDDSVFDAAESADGCNMYLYPNTTLPTYYWYGPAWLDSSIKLGANGAVEFSGTFVARGSWGRKP